MTQELYIFFLVLIWYHYYTIEVIGFENPVPVLYFL